MTQEALSFYEQAKKIAETGSSEDKIQLTQRENIPPEILYYLASDEDPKVRAAIASCKQTPYQADYILAEDSHEEVKKCLITKVADQAQSLNRLLDPEKGEVVDAILTQLASDESVSIRRVLVKAIKRIANLSRKLVLKLARDDDEEVAQSMVQSSPVLEEDDLDMLIREARGPVISAVASRHKVSEHTSESVVGADYSPAVTHLLSNKAARMSEETLHFIADQAGSHEDWQEVFVTREGLSLDVIKKLSLVISNSLIKVMLEHNYLDESQVQEVVAVVQGRIESGELDEDVLKILAEPPEPFSSAYDRAKDDFLKGALHEDDLLKKMLEEDERAYVIGAVAVLSQVPYDLVIREVNAKNTRGLMAIIWKSGLSPQFGVEFQLKMAHVDVKKLLYPKEDEFPMTESELDWQLELIFNS